MFFSGLGAKVVLIEDETLDDFLDRMERFVASNGNDNDDDDDDPSGGTPLGIALPIPRRPLSPLVGGATLPLPEVREAA